MAAIEISKAGNRLKFVLNDESNKHGYKKVSKNIDNIVDICLEKNDTFVLISYTNGSEMKLTTASVREYLTVDKVATETPTDNSDLLDKLDALLP